MEFFDEALPGLQEGLPAWMAQYRPDSELYKLLTAHAEIADELAAAIEQIHRDQAIATASDEALRSQWAPLYGVSREDLPLGTETLRAYLKAIAAEDGSVSALEETLLALLRTDANETSGGDVVRFPHLISDFDTTIDGWLDNRTGTAPGALTRDATWAATGTHSLRWSGATGELEFVGPRSPLFAVDPGEPLKSRVTFKVTTYPTGADNAVRVKWRFLDSVGTELDSLVGSYEAAGTTARTFTVTATPPDGAVFADVAVYVVSTAVSTADLAIDDFFIAVGNTYVGEPIVFPEDGSGLVLYQPTEERSYLRFPADGTGLIFPADGTGLTFPTTSRLEITESYADHRLDVTVRNFLVFDRPAFARAVARFRQAHMVEPTITETSN